MGGSRTEAKLFELGNLRTGIRFNSSAGYGDKNMVREFWSDARRPPDRPPEKQIWTRPSLGRRNLASR